MKTTIKNVTQTNTTIYLETPYDVKISINETKSGYVIECTEQNQVNGKTPQFNY